MENIEIVANNSKVFAEKSLTCKSFPEETLQRENSWFDAKEQPGNRQSRNLDFDADLTGWGCFVPSSNAIDIAAIVVLPIAYLAFNVIYWRDVVVET